MAKETWNVSSGLPYGYLDIIYSLSRRVAEAYLYSDEQKNKRSSKVDRTKIISFVLPEYYRLLAYEDHLQPSRLLLRIPDKETYEEINKIVEQTKISFLKYYWFLLIQRIKNK